MSCALASVTSCERISSLRSEQHVGSVARRKNSLAAFIPGHHTAPCQYRAVHTPAPEQSPNGIETET
eukprot:3193650-Rhodomonas_salina.3